MSQLISPSEVIAICFTNDNTDASLIGAHFVEIAQEEHIRPALAWGETQATESLYQEIVDQNNSLTLSVPNALLLETYIKPALAFYVKYELLSDMSINTTSAGLMQNFTDHSNQATDAQRGDLKTQVKSHAKTLLDKMTRFIEDTDTLNDYPKYSSSSNVTNSASVVGGVIMGTTQPRDINVR